MRDAGCEVQDARSGMSYRDLEIWKLAREIAIAVHRMTLQNLPKFEMYEQASQIRRSAKSISSNIVEGYGRRRYKQEFRALRISPHEPAWSRASASSRHPTGAARRCAIAAVNFFPAHVERGTH